MHMSDPKTGMPDRYVHKMFQIDTNRINARGGLDNMNKLEKWHNDGVIKIEMSEPSLEEAFQGNNVERRNKAAGYIYSITYADTAEEQRVLRSIEQILFPEGAKDQNQKNDVEIVFNAREYRRILVTNDGGSKAQPGGILGNAELLRNKLDVSVVTDAQAVEIVRKAIEKRDQKARYVSEKRSVPLPEWVGKD